MLFCGLLAMPWLAECAHKPDNFEDMASKAKIINDSLTSGNIAFVTHQTEALKKECLANGDSLGWAVILGQQAINSYYQGDIPKLLGSADSVLAYTSRHPVTKDVYGLLSTVYQVRGGYYDQYDYNPDSTMYYMGLAVTCCEKSGKTDRLPQTYANHANSYRMSGKLDSAAIVYHRAIYMADSIGIPKDGYLPLYNGIASVFTDMRDFDNSGVWWAKSMAMTDGMRPNDLFMTLTGYGNDQYYRKNYKESGETFRRLRNYLDLIPHARWERKFTDVNVADTWLRLGRPDIARPLLDSVALYFTAEQPNPVCISYIHTLQMRLADLTGNTAETDRLIAMHPAADTLRLEQLLSRLEFMAGHYARTGRYEQAYKTHMRYDALNDSLRSMQLRQQISTMNGIYARDTRILSLQADNSRQQANIYRLLGIIAIFFIVGLTMAVLMVTGRLRHNRREQRMMNKIMTLRQENLRSRITPHFIYNALNHELCTDPGINHGHMDAIVRLLRRQQYLASEILVPFADELDFVNDYISVMSDDGRAPLDYTCNICGDIDTQSLLFPSMALQILVENAFKHGFTTLTPGDKRVLDIAVEKTDRNLVRVSVFNNSAGTKNYPDKTGTGLHVLAETIKIINDRNKSKIRFTINPDTMYNDMQGCRAILTIPENLMP